MHTYPSYEYLITVIMALVFFCKCKCASVCFWCAYFFFTHSIFAVLFSPFYVCSRVETFALLRESFFFAIENVWPRISRQNIRLLLLYVSICWCQRHSIRKLAPNSLLFASNCCCAKNFPFSFEASQAKL